MVVESLDGVVDLASRRRLHVEHVLSLLVDIVVVKANDGLYRWLERLVDTNDTAMDLEDTSLGKAESHDINALSR